MFRFKARQTIRIKYVLVGELDNAELFGANGWHDSLGYTGPSPDPVISLLLIYRTVSVRTSYFRNNLKELSLSHVEMGLLFLFINSFWRHLWEGWVLDSSAFRTAAQNRCHSASRVLSSQRSSLSLRAARASPATPAPKSGENANSVRRRRKIVEVRAILFAQTLKRAVLRNPAISNKRRHLLCPAAIEGAYLV